MATWRAWPAWTPVRAWPWPVTESADSGSLVVQATISGAGVVVAGQITGSGVLSAQALLSGSGALIAVEAPSRNIGFVMVDSERVKVHKARLYELPWDKKDDRKAEAGPTQARNRRERRAQERMAEVSWAAEREAVSQERQRLESALAVEADRRTAEQWAMLIAAFALRNEVQIVDAQRLAAEIKNYYMARALALLLAEL